MAEPIEEATTASSPQVTRGTIVRVSLGVVFALGFFLLDRGDYQYESRAITRTSHQLMRDRNIVRAVQDDPDGFAAEAEALADDLAARMRAMPSDLDPDRYLERLETRLAPYGARLEIEERDLHEEDFFDRVDLIGTLHFEPELAEALAVSLSNEDRLTYWFHRPDAPATASSFGVAVVLFASTPRLVPDRAEFLAAPLVCPEPERSVHLPNHRVALATERDACEDLRAQWLADAVSVAGVRSFRWMKRARDGLDDALGVLREQGPSPTASAIERLRNAGRSFAARD